MVYSNGTRLDGHGKGTFEPPQPVKGNESAAQVRFVVPGEIDVTIEKARVRSGVITFIAWHSEK